MSNFDQFKNEVVDGVSDLAKGLFKEYVDYAKSDIEFFVDQIKDDLPVWQKQAMDPNDPFSEEELKSLLRMQDGLLDLAKLTAKGIAATKLNRFRDGVIDLISSKAKLLL